MSLIQQTEKLEGMINGIVNEYHLVCQSSAMLTTLLEDSKVNSQWDDTMYGKGGMNSVAYALFCYITTQIHAIVFDVDKRSASAKNIVKELEDDTLVAHIKSNFCNVDEDGIIIINNEKTRDGWLVKHLAKTESDGREKEFSQTLETIKQEIKRLEQLDVFKRIKKFRNKIGAHKDMKGRSLFSPEDCIDANNNKLTFGCASELVKESEALIFGIKLLLTGCHDSPDSRHNELVARQFWGAIKP